MYRLLICTACAPLSLAFLLGVLLLQAYTRLAATRGRELEEGSGARREEGRQCPGEGEQGGRDKSAGRGRREGRVGARGRIFKG